MRVALSGKLMPIVITLLGVAFILQVAVSLALGVMGERGTAVVTHIRREGGERNEVTPNKYTYIVSYKFITADGKVVSDSVRRIGNSVYLKASGKEHVPVRYLKSFPIFNTLEKDTELSWGQVIMLVTGVFLIVVMNRPGGRKVKHRADELSPVESEYDQFLTKPRGDVTGCGIGFSTKINDPAFARDMKDTTRWTFLFSAVLAVIAVIGFYIYGETSGEMDNPEALYIGLGIGGMFLTIAAFQVMSRGRSKSWDGVVIDKKIEEKQRKRNYGDNDYVWEPCILYSVVFRSDDGKMHTNHVENDDTSYCYYEIGDRVRYHQGLNTFEKYDKSRDRIVFCNACASLNDIQRDTCYRCHCPLLK